MLSYVRVIGVMVALAVIIVAIAIATIFSTPDQITGPGLMYEPNLSEGGIFYKNSAFSQREKSNAILDRMKMFMKHYDIDKKDAESLQSVLDCNPDTGTENLPGEFCVFKQEWIGEGCSEAMNFGYGMKPCIFLLFNEIENWKPDPYQVLEELPEHMPVDLQDHIHYVTSNNNGKIPQVLWIHCEGEKPADRENLGTIRYHSPWKGWHGIPAYYFPYVNNESYYSPILAIQLENPQSDILLHLECKVWAKNIIHSKDDGQGGVTIRIARLEGKKKRK